MIGVGSGLQHIHLKDLRQDMVPIAPAVEQQEIVARLRKEMGAIERLYKVIRTARAQIPAVDQSTLAKAFRGELVPQDPNNEPASALLARIKADRSAKGISTRQGRGRAVQSAE